MPKQEGLTMYQENETTPAETEAAPPTAKPHENISILDGYGQEKKSKHMPLFDDKWGR